MIGNPSVRTEAVSTRISDRARVPQFISAEAKQGKPEAYSCSCCVSCERGTSAAGSGPHGFIWIPFVASNCVVYACHPSSVQKNRRQQVKQAAGDRLPRPCRLSLPFIPAPQDCRRQSRSRRRPLRHRAPRSGKSAAVPWAMAGCMNAAYHRC